LVLFAGYLWRAGPCWRLAGERGAGWWGDREPVKLASAAPMFAAYVLRDGISPRDGAGAHRHG